MATPPVRLVSTSRNKDGYQLSIFSNLEAQKKNLLRFTAIGVERATYRALNKTGGKANTRLKRDISHSYNLAQKTFAKSMYMQKAGPGKLTLSIRGTGKQIPIIEAKGGAKQTALGVKINTGKSQLLKGHFIAKVGKHVGVFRRKDNAKHKKMKNRTTGVSEWHALGITERKYPSVAHMVSNDERGDRIWLFIRKEYPMQLKAQLNAEADKRGALSIGGRPFSGRLPG